jgi:catechol 2,3-dioxygenase-like lactoylglutathione lyase family enzyme
MAQKTPSGTIGLSCVNHVGIVVSDLDASIRFYEALTGTKVETKDMVGGARLAALMGMDEVLIRYAMVHLDEFNLELVQYDEPAPKTANYAANEISAMHLAFEVDDLDAVYDRMTRAGLAFASAPLVLQQEDMLRFGIGAKVAYFEDPDGTHLEIIEPQGSFRRRSRQRLS